MDAVPELNEKQLDRLSEFLSNFSLLIIATFVLPNLFNLDKPKPDDLKLGLIVAAGMQIVSLTMLRRKND